MKKAFPAKKKLDFLNLMETKKKQLKTSGQKKKTWQLFGGNNQQTNQKFRGVPPPTNQPTDVSWSPQKSPAAPSRENWWLQNSERSKLYARWTLVAKRGDEEEEKDVDG